MTLKELLQRWIGKPSASRRSRPQASRRRGLRLTLEQLEDRCLPSNYAAASVSELIADINAANLAGGSNTITLAAGTTFTLTAVDNTTDGATGLPVIAANDNLTIVGNGDVIQRSTATGTPALRLLDVAGGASLTLQNLTLQGGWAFGSGVSAEGGAIYNQGSLDLNGVTVQNNIAQGNQGATGQAGQAAAGGAVYSNGALTMEGSTKLQNNQAIGGQGGAGGVKMYRPRGGNGFGGALYVAGGTIALTDDTLTANAARGGPGGMLGFAIGGGLYVSSGTVTLTNDTISSNTAQGFGSFGGGLYVAGGTVSLTSAIVSSNTAQGSAGGGYGFGGALYVAGGTVSLTSAIVSSNTAQGGAGGTSYGNGFPGGNGFGGALYMAGGTVTLTGDTFASNAALGGQGGRGVFGVIGFTGGGYQGQGGAGGNGYGGALYAAGGTLILRNDSVTGNSAVGGAGGRGGLGYYASPGLGEGGGLFIDALAAVCLDAFTQAHVTNNTASTQDPNIHGAWASC